MEAIDIHTHGIGGYDTKTITVEHVLKIAEIHGSNGVSKILPAIYPGPIEDMRANMITVKRAMVFQSSESKFKSPELDNSTFNIQHSTFGADSYEGAKIIGVHLEGPFLNPSRCGALNPLSFLNPTVDNLKRLTEGFEDMIKIITVAPELDGAIDLIRAAADMGIIVSMGHSDAAYQEAREGFHAGAKGITHIFNAMRGFHHREPGIAGFGFTNPHVYIEVIADPYHLHPETIKLIFKGKPPEKIIIISDSVKDTVKTGSRKTENGFQGVRDLRGILKGGAMTVVESARRLIDMGYEENIITNCISGNPEAYLSGR
ncbi:MAG: amidohydrolase family protein [Proteobacteria bacterium]|nr:amidohydrolase family protein [Pseudomonadota bacterium]